MNNLLPNNTVKRNLALSIGNFDGMHLGHQYLFTQLKAIAKSQHLSPAILTFEPHPNQFFGQKFTRLNTLRDRKILANKQGLLFFVLRFKENIAQMIPEAFLDYLKKLGMQALVVGSDFRFGVNQTGDIHYLKNMSEKKKFKLCVIDDFLDFEKRISSSFIREALKKHDLKKANQLLGYQYFISGRVVSGKQRGRTLGTPTLNLNLSNSILAVLGVYAVYVDIDGHGTYPGVCNVGYAPTFDHSKYCMEVHIYDQKLPELYGKLIQVEFFHYLRGEKKFNQLQDLKQQIQNDIFQAKSYFKYQGF